MIGRRRGAARRRRTPQAARETAASAVHVAIAARLVRLTLPLYTRVHRSECLARYAAQEDQPIKRARAFGTYRPPMSLLSMTHFGKKGSVMQ